MSELSGELVSEAIVLWTGKEEGFASPTRDMARVVERYGATTGEQLAVEISRLAEDFSQSDAQHRVSDHDEMVGRASNEFRARHPEISSAAVEALAWCYSWDWFW